MAKGDAVYARGNVDWPLDPQCQGLPDNDCRWLHEVLWRMAVKERSPVVPKKYNAKWLAWVCQIAEPRVCAYVKILAAAELIGVDSQGQLVVYGVIKQHGRLGFKVQEYPEVLPLQVVTADAWEWGKPSAPVSPHSAPVPSHTGPNEIDTLNIDTLNRENDTVYSETAPPSAESTAAPPPIAPQPPTGNGEVAPGLRAGRPGDAAEPSCPPSKGDTGGCSSSVPVLDAPAKGIKPFLCDGTPNTWTLTERKVREWEETYKTIIVRDAIRAAWQWIQDNPTKRKTASGMIKFLGNWLHRSVNRNEHKKPTPPKAPPAAGTHSSPSNDPFVLLCHALQKKHPHLSKPEIGKLAEAELDRQQRQKAYEASRRKGDGAFLGDTLANNPHVRNAQETSHP